MAWLVVCLKEIRPSKILLQYIIATIIPINLVLKTDFCPMTIPLQQFRIITRFETYNLRWQNFNLIYFPEMFT